MEKPSRGRCVLGDINVCQQNLSSALLWGQSISKGKDNVIYIKSKAN